MQTGLNLLSGKDDIIIMGDGKLVAKGLKMNFEGDINLFGHENNPNLDKLISELNGKLDFVGKSCVQFGRSISHDKLSILQDLQTLITDLIRRVKIFHLSEQKKLTSYINRQNRNDNKFPEKAISSCKTNMYTASLWVKKALQINMNLCEMASSLHKNLHTFKSVKSIESKEITNLHQLHEADYVFSNLNPMDYPHLFMRYSYVWQDLIQQSVMSDYIFAYNSIGLSGLNAMRNYFQKFIKQEGSPFRMPGDNYKDAELDGICTVCIIFTPAFLPTCAVVYEEGCSFVKGRTRKELICCTPNAFIRSQFIACLTGS